MSENNAVKNTPELLGLMTSGIAHDLNNFLSPIMLGVQTLQRTEQDEKTMRVLSMIEQSSRKAADLIRHLLDYSQRLRQSRATTSVLSMKAVVDGFVADHESNSIEMSIEPPAEMRFVVCDNEVIRIILECALENALESNSSSSVTVACSIVTVDAEYKRTHRMARSGEYVCIAVRDEGRGIDPEDLKHVCDPFFSTHRDENHSGIGLFLVSTLVKQSEGFLEIESEVGKGTEIRMFLPASP